MHNTTENKNYLSLIVWIAAIIVIGSIIGSSTKPHMNTWYSTLNRSEFTPPNYVFPIVWTILYGVIGSCGWLIWRSTPFSQLRVIKGLYIMQLILNWSWTPLFFRYHFTGLSLLAVIYMDILVGLIIWLSYRKLRSVSLLMIPYLLWILCASYLNLYIWWYN